MSKAAQKALVFFAVCSLVGWILLFTGLGVRRDRRRREERERTRATGMIVDYERTRHVRRGVHSYWKPVVEFMADGETIRRAYAMFGDPEKHPVGEAVEVLYDANDPERFHLEMDTTYADGGATATRAAIVWILLSALLAIALAVLVGGADLSEFSLFGRGLFRRAPRASRKIESVTLVSSSDVFQYEVQPDGTAILKGFNGHAQEVTLPLVLDGHMVSGISNSAFLNARSIVELTVPGTYTHIPVGTFATCVALEKLTLQEGVSSVGSHAFGFCVALQEVHLPASLTRIADDAFPENCRAAFHAPEGSYARAYCEKQGLEVAE